MLKKIITAMLLIVVVFYAFGCFTHSHVVGKGPKSSQVMEEKQWYVLWGISLKCFSGNETLDKKVEV